METSTGRTAAADDGSRVIVPTLPSGRRHHDDFSSNDERFPSLHELAGSNVFGPIRLYREFVRPTIRRMNVTAHEFESVEPFRVEGRRKFSFADSDVAESVWTLKQLDIDKQQNEIRILRVDDRIADLKPQAPFRPFDEFDPIESALKDGFSGDSLRHGPSDAQWICGSAASAHTDFADILGAWRAEVRCNRELTARQIRYRAI
jgi:hypothetical protein